MTPRSTSHYVLDRSDCTTLAVCAHCQTRYIRASADLAKSAILAHLEKDHAYVPLLARDMRRRR